MTNLCNFCLKISNACNSVDEKLKQTLKFIFNNVKLVLAESSMICEDCIQRVHSACALKAAIIHNENLIVTYETNKPRQEQLVEVYLKKNKVKCDVFPNELTICRFCINLIPDNHFYSLEDMEVDTNIREIIISHLPEVDFTFTSNPMVCQTCLKKFQDYGMFIYSWLHIHKLKKNYLVCNNKTDFSDLNELRKFIFGTNISLQYFDNYDIQNTNELDNGAEGNEKKVHCVNDNIQLKNDIETHDDFNYSAENPIKIECRSSDFELMNDSKVKTEIFEAEPKMEPHDYVLKEEEISINDVKDDDSTEFENCSKRDSDSPSLCNNIQEASQHKSNECPFPEQKETIEIRKNSKFGSRSLRKIEVQLRFTKKSKELLMESRKSSYQPIKVNSEVLESHFISHSGDSILYECDHCDYKSKQKRLLKRHLMVHSNEKYKCEHCDYKSKDKSILKQHLAMHSDSFYKCGHCDYESKHKRNLKNHLIMHSKETYKCDHCVYESKYKRNLKKHMIKQCKEIYKCEHCDFEYKHKGYFQQHLATHSYETYKCEHCDYESKYKRHLKKHLIMHAKETYKCEQCDFESKYKNILKQHLITHSNEAYKCEHCDFESKRKSYLKEHLAIHSDSFHKCDHCDYKSKQKSQLKRHLMVHSDETYKCEHCDFESKHKSYFKQHLAMHSNGTYKCEHCDFESKYKGNLKKHLIMHINQTYKCEHC